MSFEELKRRWHPDEEVGVTECAARRVFLDIKNRQVTDQELADQIASHPGVAFYVGPNGWMMLHVLCARRINLSPPAAQGVSRREPQVAAPRGLLWLQATAQPLLPLRADLGGRNRLDAQPHSHAGLPPAPPPPPTLPL